MASPVIGHRWYLQHQLLAKHPPAQVLSWLFDHASLTARLKRHCHSFEVRLLSQQYQRPTLDEQEILAIRPGRFALIRQVCLYCNGRAGVYARTVIPATTLTGRQRVYTSLGNRPLGEMLFADRTMKRDEVMVAEFTLAELPLAESAGDGTCWGRRSIFRVGGKPLLVSEYFLPALVGP
jgi:chorismate--pyruvate lyase